MNTGKRQHIPAQDVKTKGHAKPDVSVIVPIYGAENYLRQCVDSLLNQTLKNIEIILVDDGSKDNCPKICDEYAQKDPRIVVIHQPNKGYGVAVNRGIERASAAYIGVVDADDWVDADMFETLYEKAKETDAEMVKTDFFKYLGYRNQDRKANAIPNTITDSVISPIHHGPVMKIGPSVWTAIYQKEFLAKNEIKFLETPGASYQDTSFHFKVLLAAQRAVFLKRAFYHYRIDNAKSSVKDIRKVFCVCDEWEEIIRWTKAHGIYNSISGLLCALRYRTYMWNWKRLSGKAKNQFLERFSKDFRELDKRGLIETEYISGKCYRRLRQIMFYPRLFRITYGIQHFPHKLVKVVFGVRNG